MTRTRSDRSSCLVAIATVPELPPMASSQAPTSCLFIGCDGFGRVALLLVVHISSEGARWWVPGDCSVPPRSSRPRLRSRSSSEAVGVARPAPVWCWRLRTAIKAWAGSGTREPNEKPPRVGRCAWTVATKQRRGDRSRRRYTTAGRPRAAAPIDAISYLPRHRLTVRLPASGSSARAPSTSVAWTARRSVRPASCLDGRSRRWAVTHLP